MLRRQHSKPAPSSSKAAQESCLLTLGLDTILQYPSFWLTGGVAAEIIGRVQGVSRLRIVVTGLAATFPLGGPFWDYLQYVLGFMRLGHDVMYIEDTGRWCYEPRLQTFIESGAQNAVYLARELARLSPRMTERWFFRDATGASWGQYWQRVVEFCRSADLFVHISGSCNMREEYFAARRVVFIDSDPMYTQAIIPEYVAGRISDPDLLYRMGMLFKHDVFLTFAENILQPDCKVPRELFNWAPTRQPIVMDQFKDQVPLSARRRVFTTVMSWDPREQGPTVNGVTYSGKSGEFLQFIDLPRRTPAAFEIAMSGRPPHEQLVQAGWKLIDGYQASADPWRYRQYLANSYGEWSVAKNAYVRSRSGWFSCRTACYLALGVPAVVQDTGFGCAVPTGDGVLKFSTLDEACEAIEAVLANPQHHAQAAYEIAREYFDSDKVLSRLVAQCG